MGRAAYGVCSDMFYGTDTFHYLSGVEVSESSALPEQFSRVHIPAQRYVIFPHRANNNAPLSPSVSVLRL